jgi:RsiW-degrading membrane proteinase PrsW (M82 family)
MWKHYVAGVIPGLVLNVIWAIYRGRYVVWVEDLIMTTIILLPFGLLAGFVGHLVSKHPPQALRDVVISFLLGILFLVAGLYLYFRISCC